MKKIFLALTFFLALTASATTYYISSSGSDVTGTGTAVNPWKTLYKATQSVTTAGDIIHVNAGSYVETAQCILSAGVSIEGDGITSIIKNNITTDWISILKLASGSEGTDGNQHISNLKFDGQFTTGATGSAIAVEIIGRKNVSVHDNTFIHFRMRGVIFAGRVDNAEAAPTVYATGNEFYNNIMDDCAEFNQPLTAGFGCLNIGGQQGMQIYNNTITQNSRSYGFNGWPIKYYNGGYLKGVRIHHNTLTKIQMNNYVGGYEWDFAIELFNQYGIEIDSNTISGGGIDLNYTEKNGYSYGAYIHDNTVSMPVTTTWQQSFVTLEFYTKDVIIYRNTADNVTQGVLFTPRAGDTVRNVLVHHNLITNMHMGQGAGGFVTFNNNASNYIQDIEFYNNTLLSSGLPTYWGYRLPSGLTSGYAKRLYFRNNIMIGPSSGPFVQQGGNQIDSVFITHNDIYNTGNSNTPVYEAGAVTPSHYSFTSNTNTNPAFSATGYKLVIGSPLIDAGINVGLAYTGAAPDKNWREDSAAAPPAVCTSMDSARSGGGYTFNTDKTVITKAGGYNSSSMGQQGFSSGKVFYQFKVNTMPSPNWGINFGFANSSAPLSVDPGNTADEYYMSGQNILYHSGYFSDTYTTLNTLAAGDTVGIAVDMTAGTADFYINRTILNGGSHAYTSIPAGTYYPAIGGHDFAWQATAIFNPTWIPAGYTALCTGGSSNINPVANAGGNRTITLPTSSITLTGSGTDADGTIASYSWTRISGPNTPTLSGASTATLSIGATGTAMIAGTYVYQLTVTDNLGATHSNSATITVNPANVAPVANAGTDQTTLSSSVTLTGSGTDSDGSVVSYAWSQVSGSSCTIVSPSSSTTAVNSMAVGVYVFRLTVTDNVGATGTDDITITVTSSGRYIKRNYVNL